jgi:hypothetical protein
LPSELAVEPVFELKGTLVMSYTSYGCHVHTLWSCILTGKDSHKLYSHEIYKDL